MEWLEFVIKPSNYISSLCYSVFRIEPFKTCSYACIYCYARWYRGPHGAPAAKPWVPRLFEKLARKLPDDLPRPFFRLSTLSDPFQPVGGKVSGVVKDILRAALRHQVPLVVNTKGLVTRDSEALSLILSLADHGLLLLQYTIGFGDGVAQLLEPAAPPPTERLLEAEQLSEQGVPIIVRVQPLIPGLEEEHLRAAEEALSHGAKGLIAEPIREIGNGLQMLYQVLGFNEPAGCWEPYQLGEEPGREPLLHPCPEWRLHVHEALASVAARHGAPYAACKDTILAALPAAKWYRPGRTCCLEWLAYREEPLLRPTLHEYAYLGWPDKAPQQLCEELGPPYVCGEQLAKYPKPIRKGIQQHMRKLQTIIENKEKLRKMLERLGDLKD
ncbi:radical SAM protein [Pyrofollis japonicus]|uniref:hypothetical protein n=1 Tax=Pyrofollis japonicus TaxID=3060460 RepID=UPI00295BD1BE|nr:hypothetical protein [Pyrofollis japonicus]BEP17971.1 radical SAM protein [Pyrofollis japonicus]